MKVDAARDVLLVHALETTDRKGEIEALTPEDRSRATKTADGDVGARARILREELEKKHRPVRVALAASRGHGWMGWGLIVICLVTGFFSNKLGNSRVIDVLAFPLLGLITWNLLVYLLIAVFSLKRGGKPGWITRLFEMLGEKLTVKKIHADSEGLLARGVKEFAANWLQASASVRESRIRAMLHIAAAILVAGMVGGMYWKGLAVEYKAGWESTFITQPEPVQKLYGVIFKPASMVSGIEVPTIDEVNAARSGEGKAAKWIHLFAVTVVLLVFVPRLLLAIWSWRRARRLENEIDVIAIDPDYFRRLEKATQGGTSVALVVPHRLDPTPALRAAVRTRLHDLWGGALVVEFADTVGYGDEEEAGNCLPPGRELNYIVPLMSLASTPEDESQGLLVDVLKAAAPEAVMFVLLDAASFMERLEGMPEKERRQKERGDAWGRLMNGRAPFSVDGNVIA